MFDLLVGPQKLQLPPGHPRVGLDHVTKEEIPKVITLRIGSIGTKESIFSQGIRILMGKADVTVVLGANRSNGDRPREFILLLSEEGRRGTTNSWHDSES